MNWWSNDIGSRTELGIYYFATVFNSSMGGFLTSLGLIEGLNNLFEVSFFLVSLLIFTQGLSSFIIVNKHVGQSYGLQLFLSVLSVFFICWGFIESSISLMIAGLIPFSVIAYQTDVKEVFQNKIDRIEKEKRYSDSSNEFNSKDIEDPHLLRNLKTNLEDDIKSIDKNNLQFLDIYIEGCRKHRQQLSFLSDKNSEKYNAKVISASEDVDKVIKEKLGIIPSKILENDGRPQAFNYYSNSLREVLDIFELSFRILETDLDYIKFKFVLREESNIIKKYSLNNFGPVDNDIHYYIDNFVDEKGRGTEEEREKLANLIRDNIKEDLSKSDILNLVEEKTHKREKEAVKSIFQSNETEELDDNVEKFISYLGKGNEKTISLAAEVLDIPRREFEEEVREKFDSIRKENELNQLKSDIGIESKNTFPEKDIEKLEESNMIKKLISKNYTWKEINEMSGLEFEEFVESLFSKMNYKAKQTSKSGDQGADVVAENSDEKIAIQAKNKKTKTSNSAVQEVKAAIAYYNCDRGIVVSTSEFTNSAKELAEENNIELWSKEKIKTKKAKYLDENRI